MIENKFNDPSGFENKNTFFQFDQWETQVLQGANGNPGAKNRFVYDFSFPVIDGKSDNYLLTTTDNNSLYKEKIFSNLSSGVGSLEYGNPGGKAEYRGSAFSTSRTVNEDEATISVDKDVLMNIDSIATYAFGATDLKDVVNFFRSGYVEFSIKTDNENCIIASGSSEIDSDSLSTVFAVFGQSMDFGASISSLSSGDTMSPKNIEARDYPYYQANSFDGALINLNIRIIDGQLAIEYYDEYNKENVNFVFIGNEYVSDNEWHHVVINFGRPGLIKTHGVKHNKKFVEIWIDGQLDKRFDDKVNDYQIFYPVVKWLFNNPKDIIMNVLNNELDVETNMDIRGKHLFLSEDNAVGFNEITGIDGKIFDMAINSDFFKQNAYSGSIHTFAHGVNIPISQYEIKRRMRLWKKQTKKFAKIIDVYASMVNPSVSTNSKKALKLFWNNIVEGGKFGVELDNNFQVESYSVTHKTKNSSTEIFNFDMANSVSTNILENVRIVLTEDILVNGPGLVFFANTEESNNYGPSNGRIQTDPKQAGLDSVLSDLSSIDRFVGPRSDLTFSGITLNNGDRILLTNQIKSEENGIWVFNGLDKYLTRPSDALLSDESVTNVVYVSEGINSGTYWKLNKAFVSLSNPQKWSLVNTENIANAAVSPDFDTRWKNDRGQERFINVLEDISLSKYDVITFMNYPESNDEIFELFPNDPQLEVIKMYNAFLNNLKIAAANGANLFVSSPKLAEDLGIVKKFTLLSQETEESDAHSAQINPFQFDEPAERYFDTHRQNQYHIATPIPGLTDKETWVITDAINYIPKDQYDHEELHVKYSYRQNGLQENNEFFIPSLPLTKASINKDIPGNRQNARLDSIYAIAPTDLLAGTAVTKFANTHYHGAEIAYNEYDDYVTTVVITDGQLLGNYPISGKIFVNCTEDSYTMSREEYNYATIQIVPEDDINESAATRLWQYSTTRLNRLPNRVNVRELTSNGQTTPTLGGGGPIVQASTNSSNGIIRSATDATNKNTQSDLYPSEAEEIYPIQKIPVFSMTWLGLQWLAG